jgi:MFS superfamily sulfate permease-like transporter
VFSALWVALFAIFGAGLIAHIPIPAMAGSILLIAWGWWIIAAFAPCCGSAAPSSW